MLLHAADDDDAESSANKVRILHEKNFNSVS